MFVSVEVDSARKACPFKATSKMHVRLEDIFLREDYPNDTLAGQFFLLFRAKEWVYRIDESTYHKLKRLLAIDHGAEA